jgi:hypothetical protein
MGGKRCYFHDSNARPLTDPALISRRDEVLISDSRSLSSLYQSQSINLRISIEMVPLGMSYICRGVNGMCFVVFHFFRGK